MTLKKMLGRKSMEAAWSGSMGATTAEYQQLTSLWIVEIWFALRKKMNFACMEEQVPNKMIATWPLTKDNSTKPSFRIGKVKSIICL